MVSPPRFTDTPPRAFASTVDTGDVLGICQIHGAFFDVSRANTSSDTGHTIPRPRGSSMLGAPSPHDAHHFVRGVCRVELRPLGLCRTIARPICATYGRCTSPVDNVHRTVCGVSRADLRLVGICHAKA